MAEKPICMLVVEDNPADALLVRKALSEAGPHSFRMEHTTRLDAAAKRLAEKGVDVILLDLSLPDEQGLETLRRVQAAAPSLPIVVLTGMDDEAIALEAVRSGAQ